MIDVIVSNSCPHCDSQLDAMQKSFFTDEYRIINVDSQDFKEYGSKDLIAAVPFVVVREPDGSVKYAAAGVHDGTELRKIERGEKDASAGFNLRRARVALAQ